MKKYVFIWIPVGLLVIFGSTVGFIIWYDAPPLSISRGHGVVIIDARQWGEYGTVVKSLSLIETHTGKTIWKIVASKKIAVIHTFNIIEGDNPVHLNGNEIDGFKVVVPEKSQFFKIEKNKQYCLKIVSGRLCASRRGV